MGKGIITSNRAKGILAAIFASVLWSSGGIFIKLLDWNPIAISGSRSLIAVCILIAYSGKPKLTKSKPMIGGAIAYSATVLLFVTANKMTTSANAILLQYTAPIFVAILGVWLLKEKIHIYDAASITVVFLGMILFFLGNVNSGNMIGNFLAILSGLTLACTTIALRMEKDAKGIDIPIIGNILTFLIATPFILNIKPDFKSIVIIIILGIFQLGISYIFYVYSMKYLTALEAILITVLEPLLNPLWVFIFSGEKPGLYSILGGVIVISAVLARSIYVSKKITVQLN